MAVQFDDSTKETTAENRPDMPASHRNFGNLLEEEIKRVHITRKKPIGDILDEFGYELRPDDVSKGRHALGHWYYKKRIPASMEDVTKLATLIVTNSDVDREWLKAFLDSAAVRLVTFNVKGSDNPMLPTVPGELARLDPDIMLFQECSPGMVAAVAAVPALMPVAAPATQPAPAPAGLWGRIVSFFTGGPQPAPAVAPATVASPTSDKPSEEHRGERRRGPSR